LGWGIASWVLLAIGLVLPCGGLVALPLAGVTAATGARVSRRAIVICSRYRSRAASARLGLLLSLMALVVIALVSFAITFILLQPGLI
jgi:hypothetical protein